LPGDSTLRESPIKVVWVKIQEADKPDLIPDLTNAHKSEVLDTHLPREVYRRLLRSYSMAFLRISFMSCPTAWDDIVRRRTEQILARGPVATLDPGTLQRKREAGEQL
jgi:hypothetical protein